MSKKKGIIQYFSIGTIGLHLVSGVIVGVLLGYFLDKYFGTSPWLTIIFFFLGIAAGFRNMYKDVQKYIISEEKNNKD
ncbi:ATP synthase protein I [Persephonella hydrogeniphila]|uniref:ATP synthase protein I n=1 Tax=Persephonella hydrogeniphila TaxID=198703 RepID=A0A285NJ57_9AQUI|nr:AtpZ/AtpI family protein [Persephonella hydrogeniphila]SNZ07896.1 ATP synthase protein I [Persephonella hydrogeniphila]